MKKLLSIILTLMLLLSVLPTGLFSITASAATSGYYTFSVENGKATITACITTVNGNITIPSTFDGYPVTTIGFRAFQGCTSLSGITIPDSVTEIDYEAFKGCTSLSSISIPDSVTIIGQDAFYNTAYYNNSSNWENKVLYIGKHLIRAAASISGAYTIKSGTKTIVRDAFSDCTRLTSITIPESVAEISWNAFSNCTSLETVNYNATNCATMGHPGYQAFSGCTNLITVNIGENVTNIPSYAFCSCSMLTSITIPASVKSIGYYAFYYCENLKSITVAQENANYSSTDGVLFNKDKTILFFYPVGKTDISYSIPNSVTSIDNYAFENCTWLGSITIGGSVASIGKRAFENCTSLKNITIPDSVTEVGDYAFSDCSSLESVTIGNRVISIGDHAFSSCDLLSSIIIPDSVTEIGDHAFYSCDLLSSIIIPDSVTEIGDHAFSSCDLLSSITIKGNVTAIGNSVFSNTAYYFNSLNWEDDILYIGNCLIDALTSISGAYTIKDGTKTIADGAFSNCTLLESITIPDSVTVVGYSAFSNCTLLGSIIVTEDNMNYTSVDGVLFNKDKTILLCYPVGKTDKSYLIPNSVTEIGYRAFSDCTSLEYITIPNSVTKIGYEAFYSCTSLSSITIPNSVTEIDKGAFRACYSLKSITLPFVGSSRTASGTQDAVFGYIFGSGSPSSLVSVTITDTAQIPYGAFSNCSRLTSITIPDSVTVVGYRAFYNCSSLKNITLSNSVTEIGHETFYNCSSLKNITIPDNVKKLGYRAFYNCSSLKNITIPNKVTEIGYETFYNCSSLSSITIPDNVTKVGSSAFKGCTSLQSITLPFVGSSRTASRTKDAVFGYIFGYTYSYEAGTTSQNYATYASIYYYIPSSLKSVTITDTTQIPYGAFSSCSQLTSITIPDSVETIENYAFYLCSYLSSVYYTGTQADKNEISIGLNNSPLTSATWYYEFCADSTTKKHIYDNMCDTDCNICHKPRSITHTYDNACDTTCNVVGCGFTRVANHIFDNDCDATCNVTDCGYTREVEHKFSDTWSSGENSHWKECACGAKTELAEHKYTVRKYNADEHWRECVCGKHEFEYNFGHGYSRCYDEEKHWLACECGYVIDVDDHDFDNACDTTCWCGATRTVGAHKYSDSCDTSCNLCKATRKITHTYKTTTIKAKINVNGSIVKKCKVCGNVYKKTVINKIKTVTLSTTKYTYNGKTKKPSVKIYDSKGNKLKYGTDYTYSRPKSSKKVGKYKIKVTFKGDYSGTKNLYYEIKKPSVKKSSVSKLTALKKSLKVSIKKASSVTGYQIEYSTSKKFKSSKKKTTTKTSYTIKSLKQKKTYYVRVRSYKTVGGKKFYSAWSSYKYKKTK